MKFLNKLFPVIRGKNLNTMRAEANKAVGRARTVSGMKNTPLVIRRGEFIWQPENL